MRRWDAELFAPLIGWADLLRRGIAPLIKQCTSPPFTLVHGDAHLDNIFFAAIGSTAAAPSSTTPT